MFRYPGLDENIAFILPSREDRGSVLLGGG